MQRDGGLNGYGGRYIVAVSYSGRYVVELGTSRSACDARVANDWSSVRRHAYCIPCANCFTIYTPPTRFIRGRLHLLVETLSR